MYQDVEGICIWDILALIKYLYRRLSWWTIQISTSTSRFEVIKNIIIMICIMIIFILTEYFDLLFDKHYQKDHNTSCILEFISCAKCTSWWLFLHKKVNVHIDKRLTATIDKTLSDWYKCMHAILHTRDMYTCIIRCIFLKKYLWIIIIQPHFKIFCVLDFLYK